MAKLLKSAFFVIWKCILTNVLMRWKGEKTEIDAGRMPVNLDAQNGVPISQSNTKDCQHQKLGLGEGLLCVCRGSSALPQMSTIFKYPFVVESKWVGEVCIPRKWPFKVQGVLSTLKKDLAWGEWALIAGHRRWPCLLSYSGSLPSKCFHPLNSSSSGANPNHKILLLPTS